MLVETRFIASLRDFKRNTICWGRRDESRLYGISKGNDLLVETRFIASSRDFKRERFADRDAMNRVSTGFLQSFEVCLLFCHLVSFYDRTKDIGVVLQHYCTVILGKSFHLYSVFGAAMRKKTASIFASLTTLVMMATACACLLYTSDAADE